MLKRDLVAIRNTSSENLDDEGVTEDQPLLSMKESDDEDILTLMKNSDSENERKKRPR